MRFISLSLLMSGFESNYVLLLLWFPTCAPNHVPHESIDYLNPPLPLHSPFSHSILVSPTVIISVLISLLLRHHEEHSDNFYQSLDKDSKQ